MRCLHTTELTFEPMTALIGPNGAGKSSVVRALEFLFGEAEVDDFDCTAGIAESEVRVTATFAELSAQWATRLAPWLIGETLTITRRAAPGQEARWTTERTQVEGFSGFRRAAAAGESAESLKTLYRELRTRYGDLPTYQNKQQAHQALLEFEMSNEDTPRERAPDATLRFGGGGEYDLRGMIELLVLPAFRDATSDAGESRGSNLRRLVELTVRSEMDVADELRTLEESTAAKYRNIVATSGTQRLDDLATRISKQLGAFAPGTSVRLAWDERRVSLDLPTVSARLVESGHEADIGRQGHGVQRAYVFALLRALLDARRADQEATPGVVLVVEEPEAYQHPVRARYVASVLAGLANDVAQSTQVVYTTHSPYFVTVDNVPAVRLLRLRDVAEVPGLRVTRVTQAALPQIAARLDTANDGRGAPWTAARVAASLPGLLGSNVSEGLFADAVVLVEGDEDVGMIDGAAAAAGVELAGSGIALLSVGGKSQLLVAAALFRALDVPTYVVFDTDLPTTNDRSGHEWLNRALTWMVDGIRESDPATGVRPGWANASPTLRAVVNDEVGEDVVEDAYRTAAAAMNIAYKKDLKNGHLVRTAIRNLYDAGHRAPTLDSLVVAVRQFRDTALGAR